MSSPHFTPSPLESFAELPQLSDHIPTPSQPSAGDVQTPPNPRRRKASTPAGADGSSKRGRGRGMTRGSQASRGRRGRGGTASAPPAVSSASPSQTTTVTPDLAPNQSSVAQLPDTSAEAPSSASGAPDSRPVVHLSAPAPTPTTAAHLSEGLSILPIGHLQSSSLTPSNSFTTLPPPSRTSSAASLNPSASAPSPHATGSSSQVGMGKKATRDVNTIFRRNAGSQDDQVCTICEDVVRNGGPAPLLQWTYKHSTSVTVLREHIGQLRATEYISRCIAAGFEIKIKDLDPLADITQDRKSFTASRFLTYLISWIVEDDQSINVVDNHYFRRLLLLLRDGMEDSEIPHRTKVRTEIAKTWKTCFDTLSEEMQTSLGSISLTSDLWSDPQLHPFMAITAHWIQEVAGQLHLRSDLIAFHAMPGHHTGNNISKVFVEMVDRAGIIKQIGYITLDNASNNDTFMVAMEGDLSALGIRFQRHGNRIRCFPHIINLGVKAALELVPRLIQQLPGGERNRDVLQLAREIARQVRSSSLRREGFQEVVNIVERNKEAATPDPSLPTSILQLLRDVDTRWSSTYFMLRRIRLLRRPLDVFLSHPDQASIKHLRPSDTEWRVIDKLCSFLQIPNMVQQLMSGETSPNLSAVLPAYTMCMKKWAEFGKQEPDFKPLADAGLAKLEEYYNRSTLSTVYLLALILNPAIRLKQLERDWNDPLLIVRARHIFTEEMRSVYNPTTSEAAAAAQAPRAAEDNAIWSVLGSNDLEDSATNDIDVLTPANYYDAMYAERDQYLTEHNAYNMKNSSRSADLLAYWQARRYIYPTLFRLAMNVLPAQASAVPCERVFSSSKETTTMRRNQITAPLMESLQMVKYMLKKARLNMTARLDPTDIEYEMELATVRLQNDVDDNDDFLTS